MKIQKSIVLAVTLLLAVIQTLQAQEIFDAVKNNDLVKVKALVEKDSSLVNLKDAAGNTSLHHAAIIGSIPLAEYLLSKGSDINAENKLGKTVLHEALLSKNYEIARFLIYKGCELQKLDNSGRSPLHIAASANALSIMEILIARGINIDIRKGRGFTPFLRLSLRNHDKVDAASLLVKHGADVNAKDSNDSTPLMLAALFPGSNELIELLLDNNAVFDTTPQQAKRMLRASAGRGLLRLFKYVIEKAGEDVLFDDNDANISLMRSATAGGSIEIVRSLLARNILLSLEPDMRGRTPLHLAAENNKPEMLEFLVRNGADTNLRTKSGKSAYNLAEENGHKELLSLILKLGGNSEPQKFPVLIGPYLGQKPPTNREVFAPDIVIRNHSTIAVSPDGKELYWNSGPTVGDGPIMMTKIVDGKWIKPVEAPFSGKKYSPWDDCPFVTPDNKRMFFISRRPINGREATKENIWYVERTALGWSEPIPVSEEINAMPLHWQMSVSNNGNLYFRSNNDEGNGVFCSSFVNGKYTKPKFTGVIRGTSPYVSPDEKYMIFVRLVSNQYVPYICFKSGEGQWGEPIDIKKYTGRGACFIVSPDGKYIFVDDSWAPAEFIEALTPKE